MNPFTTVTAFTMSAMLGIAVAFAQKMDNDDAAAMKQLAQSNLNEIESGKMAASKAQSPAVKNFAQKMVADHGKMLEDLKAMAKRKDVNLPTNAAVKEMAQNKLMQRKSGADFDREYMEHMVKDHEKDLKDAHNIAAKAKDAEFKSAVQQATGKIQEHLSLAQSISKSAAAGSSGK